MDILLGEEIPSAKWMTNHNVILGIQDLRCTDILFELACDDDLLQFRVITNLRYYCRVSTWVPGFQLVQRANMLNCCAGIVIFAISDNTVLFVYKRPRKSTA